MPPFRAKTLTALAILVVLTSGCDPRGRAIQPIIYPNDHEAAIAMRSAPVIVLVRIGDLRLTGFTDDVAKPPEVGGPMTPTVPLDLAEIHAEVLLSARGKVGRNIEFYSWMWTSGTHGGPRLFSPHPGAIRMLFLREEGGFLHTVGDYPSYDLRLSQSWLPLMLAAWNSGKMANLEPLERLIAIRIRAEFESLSKNRLNEDIDNHGQKVNHYWASDLHELIRITGPFFAVTQLDDLCLHSTNSAARFAACYTTASNFPGRCEAYQFARQATPGVLGQEYVAGLTKSCQATIARQMNDFKLDRDLPWSLSLSNANPRPQPEILRVYATAMDPRVRKTACEVAAQTPETRDIPECSSTRPSL